MTDQPVPRPEWQKAHPETATTGVDFNASEQKEELNHSENGSKEPESNQPRVEINPNKHFGRRPTRLPQSVPNVRDEVAVRIEKIMESGVADAYQRLSPVAKQEFKLKGEQTAYKIRELLKSTHVQVKKIFRLLLAWLKLLPGINHFFLEQEAKIKTDRIIALKERLNIR